MDQPQTELQAQNTPTTNENVPKVLTPEQEEELKLRSKYPSQAKSGASSFIQKMLHKGNKKYFDSGDYNMAKSKNKPPQTPLSTTNVNGTQLKSQTACNLPTLPGSTPSTPGSVKSANFNLNDERSSLSNDDSLCQSPMTSLTHQHTHVNKLDADTVIVNGEDIEIGHEIPTPECLPPRKHSIVQSKLAANKQLPSN